MSGVWYIRGHDGAVQPAYHEMALVPRTISYTQLVARCLQDMDNNPNCMCKVADRIIFYKEDDGVWHWHMRVDGEQMLRPTDPPEVAAVIHEALRNGLDVELHYYAKEIELD